MKLVCTQENFKRAIYSTERVIGKQTTLPILENILIETEKGMLKFSATNLEIGVYIKIGARIEKEGKITIPAKLISNFVNNLPPGENIEVETADEMLKIKSGRYKATIKGLETQDFPIIPEYKSGFLFSFGGEELKKALPKLLMCVSIDGTRPELGGINVIFGENGATMAATDSFRLLDVIVPLKEGKKDEYAAFLSKISSVIVPSNTFSEVLRAINPETKEVQVAIEENQVFFQIDMVRIVSRLINGKYPEYKQIIPKEFITKVIMDKEELVRAVKMASLFTNGKTGEVSFEINTKGQEMIVAAASEEKGENSTQVKIDAEGPDQNIIFNPRYVVDGLSAITTTTVAFLANSASSPVVLRMAEEKEGKNGINDRLTYVVMPIKN